MIPDLPQRVSLTKKLFLGEQTTVTPVNLPDHVLWLQLTHVFGRRRRRVALLHLLACSMLEQQDLLTPTEQL